MSDLLQSVNDAIQSTAPAVFRALSPLGQRMVMPAGIPVQAGEAKGTQYNGTIGLLTDGQNGAVPLPSVAAALSSLGEDALGAAVKYSPVGGFPELRERWRARQRRNQPEYKISSLPVVTAGLSHSLSMIADLFGGEGRLVVAPDPYWGNYNHVFGTRTGAHLASAPAFVDGRFNPLAWEQAIASDPGLGADEPVVAIVNLPSNPGGYSPTRAERDALRDSLVRVAENRPVVVICDDAYAGLVYELDIPSASVFWDLVALRDNLIPIKVDGVTKELSYFGGRVGFVTFPFDPDSEVARGLTSKALGLTRSTIGSPVATSQVVTLACLRRGDEVLDAETEAIRLRLERRYRTLRNALEAMETDLLTPQPFNSGSFALVEIAEGAPFDAETLRRHLIEHHSTGLISVGSRFLRIAHCSVRRLDLEELVNRLDRGAQELAAKA
ncbi:MAG: aminotransferase class I/II-fold pyridoxal phosphate-dependent enzyme [Acidobacteriota bacterium]